MFTNTLKIILGIFVGLFLVTLIPGLILFIFGTIFDLFPTNKNNQNNSNLNQNIFQQDADFERFQKSNIIGSGSNSEQKTFVDFLQNEINKRQNSSF